VLSIGINLVCLVVETIITGEKATTEDLWWCLIGGVAGGVIGVGFGNLVVEKAIEKTIGKALAMGAYAGFESAARGDGGDYFTSFGAAAIGSALPYDPVFEAAEPNAYRISSEVCAQGANILADTYSDVVNSKSRNQVVFGNGVTLNIVTGGVNSWGIKTNSYGTAAKAKPTSGAAGGLLEGIASNILHLFR